VWADDYELRDGSDKRKRHQAAQRAMTIRDAFRQRWGWVDFRGHFPRALYGCLGRWGTDIGVPDRKKRSLAEGAEGSGVCRQREAIHFETGSAWR
jgi:hypothetical protein